jgi:5'-3' exonuclease
MTAPRAEKLLLLDSASLYFRAYFGVPEKVTAPDGTPVNAVRGFLDMIAHLVTTLAPTGLVACWDDDWRPAFRVEAIPSYKAHRVVDEATNTEETPDTLAPQVPVIVDVLAALGIARAGAPGFEADDVIGTLVARAVADGVDAVDVVTGDRDLFQLVDDDHHVRVLYTARGVRDLDVVDLARLRERYGVRSGQAYADLAVLRGDPSDGLPGVPGIGEKTAASLLSRFGDLDGVVAAAADRHTDIGKGQRAKLLAAAEYLAVAPAVVRVAPDAPVAVHDPALPTEPADPEALLALVERWGVRSSVNRVLAALGYRGEQV